MTSAEVYVMSPEDQFAVIGRVMSQKKEAEQKLAMLEAQATQIADKMSVMADLLRRNPRVVWFDGISTNTRYPRNSVTPKFKVGDFDGKAIADLTSQIRDTTDEVNRLTQDAAKLGF